LSAFFSRRRCHGSPVRGRPLYTESNSLSHGSQVSYRSTTRAAHHHSSPLLATNNRSSGLGPPHHPRSNAHVGSASSQQCEDQLVGDESESYYSRGARSRHNTRGIVRDSLERHGKPEPPAAAEAGLEKIRSARRNICKDAEAQTDLTPKAGHKPLVQRQRLDSTRVARTQPVEGRQYRSISPFMQTARQTSQFPVDRHEEDLAPRLSRDAPRAVPDIGCRQFPVIQRYGLDWGLLDGGPSFEDGTGLLSWKSQQQDAYEAHYRNALAAFQSLRISNSSFKG
jgi:hypothetical protein